MSNWPGKYVIGLTGNIATGKSVVRKMLEHLGAYSIDADALAHRTIAKGAPGYQPVIDTFGRWILDESGQVNRSKLGQLVFNNPEALARLEAIVHPLVEQAVDLLIKRAQQSIVAIEAIKLLEGNLASACDTIWVTDASEALQSARLTKKRGMNETDALQRIRAQNPQDDKIDAAKIVIDNTGSFEDLWKQVTAAWKEISPISDTNPVIVREAKTGDFAVQRGRPRDSKYIVDLTARIGKKTMTTDDVMAAFGEKAFLLLQLNDEMVGLAGWQVENLVTRTTDLYVAPEVSLQKGLKTLIEEIENASRNLQSEASLLFLTPDLAAHEDIWKDLGYERRTSQTLGIQAWQDAAEETITKDRALFFKQLRVDRVLRPI